MTYPRSVSDSVMVGSTNSSANGEVMVETTNGLASQDSEQKDHQQINGDGPVKEEKRENETRHLTDSPPSTNGATLAHPGGSPPVCQNCGTSTTPLWRRNELGATLCNACGLFLKLHGRARPLNLKTDTIKSRNRVKSIQQPKKKVSFSKVLDVDVRWCLMDLILNTALLQEWVLNI